MTKKYLQPKLYGNYYQLLQYDENKSGFDKWKAVDAIIGENGFFPEIRVDSVEDCEVRAVSNSPQETVNVDGTTIDIDPGDNYASLLNVVEIGTSSQLGTPTFSSPIPIDGLAGYDSLSIYNGSESWAIDADLDTKIRFGLDVEGIGKQYVMAICNIAKKSQNEDFLCWYTTTNELLFVVPKTIASTITEWKSYLASHNALIWYRSISFDQSAPQYYAIGIEGESFYGIGTVDKISPLYNGDSIDFITGTVVRSIVECDIDELNLTYNSSNQYFQISKSDMSPKGKSGSSVLFYATDFPRSSGAAADSVWETSSYYRFRDTSCTSVADFKREHKGQKFIYPVAEPEIETVSICNEIPDNFGSLTMSIGPSLPMIVSNPSDYSNAIGSTATFSVEAHSDGDLTYQWQFRKPNETEWANSTATGSTTPSINMTITSSRNGQSYRCIINGCLISGVGTMSVNDATVITSQPIDVEVEDSSTATFSVTATGANLTYQWQYSEDQGTTWANSAYATAQSDTLSFTAGDSFDGYLYRCVVTGDNGSVTSNSASLNIGTPIIILEQPSDYFGPVGSSASFTVSATGDNLTYQWKYRKSINEGWNNPSAASARTENYVLSVAARHNGYQYKCVITDGIITKETDVVVLFVTSKLDVTYVNYPGIILPYNVEYNYYYLKIPAFGTWEVSAEKDGYIDSEIVDVNEIKQYRISLYDLRPIEDFGGKTLYTPNPLAVQTAYNTLTIPLGDINNPILMINSASSTADSDSSVLNYIHFVDSEFQVDSNSMYDARFMQIEVTGVNSYKFYENKNKWYLHIGHMDFIPAGSDIASMCRLMNIDNFKFYIPYIPFRVTSNEFSAYYDVTKNIIRISNKSDSMVPMCTSSYNSSMVELKNNVTDSYPLTDGFSDVCKLDNNYYLVARATENQYIHYYLYNVTSSAGSKTFEPVDPQPSNYPLVHTLEASGGHADSREIDAASLLYKFNKLFPDSNNNDNILVLDLHRESHSFFLLDKNTYSLTSSARTAFEIPTSLSANDAVFPMSDESIFYCSLVIGQDMAASLIKLNYDVESVSYMASSFSLQIQALSTPSDLRGRGMLSCYVLPDDNILYLIRGTNDEEGDPGVLDKKLYITKIVGNSLIILNSYDVTDFYSGFQAHNISLLQMSDSTYLLHQHSSNNDYYVPISYYHDRLYEGYLV